MRISAEWLDDPAVAQVFALFSGGGYQIFAVGGCVRNAAMGLPVADVDFATDARPKDVMALAHSAGIRPLPTGIDHGTVTLLIDGQSFEVTTFRLDVETDGRHAVIAFADDMATDAARRDFTINALYVDVDGMVHDPMRGLADIRTRAIRFIGDGRARIAEDALRILRFFRFYACYGDPAAGPDADGLSACAAGADLLAGLSAERVGAEMRKLLAAADPAPAVGTMAIAGILHRILPGADAAMLAAMIDQETRQAPPLPPDWRRRLAALGGEGAETSLCLSRAETRHIAAIRTALTAGEPVEVAAYRHGADVAVSAQMIIDATGGGSRAAGVQGRAAFGAAQVFPITAHDLMPPHVPGPVLGAALKRLEAAWIAAGFSMPDGALEAARLDAETGPQ